HARAAEPTGAGIVVLPDVRGLHPYYEELALRLAEHGVDALAIDYFGRTAGAARRGPDFDYMPHVDQTTWENLATDVRAAAAYVGWPKGGNVAGMFTIGVCYGGRIAFRTATIGLDLVGAIGFYGNPVGPGRAGTPPPAEVDDQVR